MKTDFIINVDTSDVERAKDEVNKLKSLLVGMDNLISSFAGTVINSVTINEVRKMEVVRDIELEKKFTKPQYELMLKMSKEELQSFYRDWHLENNSFDVDPMQKIYEKLNKQLVLLVERSTDCSNDELAILTKSMCDISQVILPLVLKEF